MFDPSSIFEPGKAVAIIDGQWGSTGKGKLAGWLCAQNTPDIVVCDFMPNAGHTFIDRDGVSHVFKQLPVAASSCFNDQTLCFVGPHSCINPDIFFEEVNRENCFNRVFVHPLAAIIEPEDLGTEEHHASHIAATCKGGHGANVRKMLRGPGVTLAKDHDRFKPFLANTCLGVQNHLRNGAKVLIESAQGFDLSLNHGTSYPHVTGRDCMLGRLCDNAGIAPRRLGKTIVSLRTYPIRVGNTEHGHSGGFYPDQKELSWAEMAQRAGQYIEPERTTVTKRERRIFTWSEMQTLRMLRHLEPDYAFLNFVNYFPKIEGVKYSELGEVKAIGRQLEFGGCRLALLGTSAEFDGMEVL